jgi:hypothetical protein
MSWHGAFLGQYHLNTDTVCETKSLVMLRPGLQFTLEVAKKSTALLVQASFSKTKVNFVVFSRDC